MSSRARCMTSRVDQGSPLPQGATPTRWKRAGVTERLVMLLAHKKHTSDEKAKQSRFQRRMKNLAIWTAFLLASSELVNALAELIQLLVKLLP